MNDELREVMCQALTRHWHGPDADMYDLEGECECLEEAGAMLAAIEQAGYVIVHRDRWDRMIEMGRVADAINACDTDDCREELRRAVEQMAYVAGRMGDLDPLEVRANDNE